MSQWAVAVAVALAHRVTPTNVLVEDMFYLCELFTQIKIDVNIVFNIQFVLNTFNFIVTLNFFLQLILVHTIIVRIFVFWKVGENGKGAFEL